MTDIKGPQSQGRSPQLQGQSGGRFPDDAQPAAPGQGFFARAALVLETIKFSHTVFALPFAAVGAIWARGGLPSPAEIALLLVAMVAARTCAMAANRVIDADLDAANMRTRGRAIPSGLLSGRTVAAWAIGSGLIFVIAAIAFLPLLNNPWPALLALPTLALLTGYSYSKRFTMFSHYWLGASLGMAPVGAWLALRGNVGWEPLVLGAAVMFWTAGFDILYSLQDLEHDRRVGLCSIPARHGVRRSLAIARINHLVSIVLLTALFHPAVGAGGGVDGAGLGGLYLAGTVIFCGMMLYQHWLLRDGDLSRLDRAFFSANAAGSILFAAFAIGDVFC